MLSRHLVAAWMTLAFAHPAAAQLVELTPELVKVVQDQATAARAAHPTSPTEAIYAFQAAFNGHFGDIHPAALTLVDTPALTVAMTTPFTFYRAQVLAALRDLEPIPAPAPAKPALFGGVPIMTLTVTPRQMDAPNISKILIFKNDQPIETMSALAPQTFTNRMGASTTIGAGLVVFRAADFTSEGPVKILAIGSAGMEWTISADEVKKFR